MRLAPIAAILLAASSAAAQRAATVRGRVVDKQTRKPVAGATVMIGGELLATDDDGRFSLATGTGVVDIEVSAPWLVASKRRVMVTADVDVELEVEESKEVSGERIEIVDTAPAPPGVSTLDARTGRALVGGDVAGRVRDMPGAARPPAGSADVIIWGAAPRDTRTFVDGVPVPQLYHLGGYRAAVGNDLVGDIRLSPAAFGPDRGRAIGGAIDIRLADPETLPRVRAHLDVLDASASTRFTLGRVALAAALRRSHLGEAVGVLADPRELAPNVPLPRWTDGQLVARTKLADDLVATGWIIGSLDELARTLVSDDPATETTQRIDQRMVRAQVTLRRERADGYDSGTLWIGRDRGDDDLRVGLIPASQRSASWVGGLRGIQQKRLGGGAGVLLGIDLDGESTQYRRTGSLTIPAREGDPRIFGQPPGDDVAADRWYATTVDAAGYGIVDLRRGRVTASLGARLDGWMLGASRLTPRVGTTPGIGSQVILVSGDPRASVEVRLSDELTARADGGRYHQARAAADASAVFGTPDLGLEQAWHAIASATWRRRPFSVEVAGYARWLDDLVARDLSVTPRFAHALTQGGTGEVAGVQVTARAASWRNLTGWLSYSLSRSTRKDAEAAPERLFDHDQTHGLIAVAAWMRDAWTVGGRVRASTGAPRTGVAGAFFDSRSGRYQPIRGAHNGERLPAFFAADLRAERRFDVRNQARGYVYLEVQNLSGRANAEEIIYSADFAQKAYLTSLPLLAIGGVRIER
ncbi:MAG: TonB-dependent receptor [Deltaproteobacteria bacterium]|nr:TonB-dependent receptor [Deltaproteobacteria bacterium]